MHFVLLCCAFFWRFEICFPPIFRGANTLTHFVRCVSVWVCTVRWRQIGAEVSKSPGTLTLACVNWTEFAIIVVFIVSTQFFHERALKTDSSNNWFGILDLSRNKFVNLRLIKWHQLSNYKRCPEHWTNHRHATYFRSTKWRFCWIAVGTKNSIRISSKKSSGNKFVFFFNLNFEWIVY